MKIIYSVEEMQSYAKNCKKNGQRIGFVPTMGFLHEGHLSLVDLARGSADCIVLSIFVNPTQFGPNEDLDAYPRDFKRDEALCAARNVDVVFYPPVEAMYHKNHSTWVTEEALTQNLCGKSRPGHFRGVATVVTKLFNAVLPDTVVLGQKDAQQYLMLERMVRDLNFPIELIRAPIVRENDGLAMSSRNKYLTVELRTQATAISQAIFSAERAIIQGEKNCGKLKKQIQEFIEKNSGIIDYVQIVSQSTMNDLELINEPAIIAVAAFYGKTRLIDNVFINN